jgi:hypothetical protein
MKNSFASREIYELLNTVKRFYTIGITIGIVVYDITLISIVERTDVV